MLPSRELPSAPDHAAIQQKLEAYLRNIYAWGPTVKLTFPEFVPASVDGMYKVTVTVAFGDQSDKAVFYVSKDGRYMMRGDVEDLNGDPLADARKQINLDNSPSKGPADAKIVMVEYADFECPSCRAAEPGVRSIEAKYPQVRVVFKDFPLTADPSLGDDRSPCRPLHLPNRIPLPSGNFTTQSTTTKT